MDEDFLLVSSNFRELKLNFQRVFSVTDSEEGVQPGLTESSQISFHNIPS